MKEYGVIFSGPLVPRVLDGSKTQTRRAVKIKWPDEVGAIGYPAHDSDSEFIEENRVYPCWHVGDRIWMKETWGRWPDHDISDIKYKADNKGDLCPWKSPQFMPRWASRFTGDVSRTWIERLQDISEAEAKAEGVEPAYPDSVLFKDYQLRTLDPCQTAKESFMTLWQSLNGNKPGLSWADNPWVLATEFRRMK